MIRDTFHVIKILYCQIGAVAAYIFQNFASDNNCCIYRNHLQSMLVVDFARQARDDSACLRAQIRCILVRNCTLQVRLTHMIPSCLMSTNQLHKETCTGCKPNVICKEMKVPTNRKCVNDDTRTCSLSVNKQNGGHRLGNFLRKFAKNILL